MFKNKENECEHKKLTIKDWETDDYNIRCPDCKKWISYEEITDREKTDV